MPNNNDKPTDSLQPESFVLDGNLKECATLMVTEHKLKNKKNIKKTAKEQRNKGEQYVSVMTKKQYQQERSSKKDVMVSYVRSLPITV